MRERLIGGRQKTVQRLIYSPTGAHTAQPIDFVETHRQTGTGAHTVAPTDFETTTTSRLGARRVLPTGFCSPIDFYSAR